jgi:superfamily II DNA or RNA helicase
MDYRDLEVGIVIAGARTSRQAMQRLGRLLRPASGKTARLWILFGEGTMEEKLLTVIDAVTE